MEGHYAHGYVRAMGDLVLARYSARKASKHLAKAGVRLPRDLDEIWACPVGRDYLYVWLDRSYGRDRINAVVRAPSRWVHVTQVAPATQGRYYGHGPRVMVVRFETEVFRAMQGEAPNLEYTDNASALAAMIEDVTRGHGALPRWVRVVSMQSLDTRALEVYRTAQPLSKPGHVTLFAKRYQEAIMTYAPMLYYEAGKHVDILKADGFQLVGEVSKEGERRVYVDDVTYALDA